MTITITLKGLLLTVIALLGIVLLAYLIVLVANLVKTLKHTNAILVDAKQISEIAAKDAKKVDGIIEGVSESAGVVTEALKGNKNIIAAATNVINAVSNVIGTVKKAEAQKSKSQKKQEK